MWPPWKLSVGLCCRQVRHPVAVWVLSARTVHTPPRASCSAIQQVMQLQKSILLPGIPPDTNYLRSDDIETEPESVIYQWSILQEKILSSEGERPEKRKKLSEHWLKSSLGWFFYLGENNLSLSLCQASTFGSHQFWHLLWRRLTHLPGLSGFPSMWSCSNPYLSLITWYYNCLPTCLKKAKRRIFQNSYGTPLPKDLSVLSDKQRDRQGNIYTF